jgi:hypothetical protein
MRQSSDRIRFRSDFAHRRERAVAYLCGLCCKNLKYSRFRLICPGCVSLWGSSFEMFINDGYSSTHLSNELDSTFVIGKSRIGPL